MTWSSDSARGGRHPAASTATACSSRPAGPRPGADRCGQSTRTWKLATAAAALVAVGLGQGWRAERSQRQALQLTLAARTTSPDDRDPAAPLPAPTPDPSATGVDPSSYLALARWAQPPLHEPLPAPSRDGEPARLDRPAGPLLEAALAASRPRPRAFLCSSLSEDRRSSRPLPAGLPAGAGSPSVDRHTETATSFSLERKDLQTMVTYRSRYAPHHLACGWLLALPGLASAQDAAPAKVKELAVVPRPAPDPRVAVSVAADQLRAEPGRRRPDLPPDPSRAEGRLVGSARAESAGPAGRLAGSVQLSRRAASS